MAPMTLCETDTGRKIIDGEISAELASAQFYTLDLAARYVFHSLGVNDVRPYLERVARAIKAPGYIVDTVVGGDYRKRSVIDLHKIPITTAELDVIAGVDKGAMKKKVVFTLLCLAKYSDAYRSTDGGWENRSIEEVSALANVSLSKERMCYLLYDLKEAGLIGFSNRVSSTSVCVKFIDRIGEPVAYVTDMRNLGWRYEQILGKPFSICPKCGSLFPATLGSDFCPSCREEPKIDINKPWYSF